MWGPWAHLSMEPRWVRAGHGLGKVVVAWAKMVLSTSMPHMRPSAPGPVACTDGPTLQLPHRPETMELLLSAFAASAHSGSRVRLCRPFPDQASARWLGRLGLRIVRRSAAASGLPRAGRAAVHQRLYMERKLFLANSPPALSHKLFLAT